MRSEGRRRNDQQVEARGMSGGVPNAELQEPGQLPVLCRVVFASVSLLLSLPLADPLGATTPNGTVDERPRIGLALSGGGARGSAHIGVLKVLEELRIPVDYIAGTSMGAIVGGLYSSGLSAAEVEQVLSTMDWDAVGEDQPERQNRRYRRKEDDQRYVMNLEIGLKGFVLPRGLRSGQRFTYELRKHTWPVTHVRDFSQLPVPFKAVAADLETGERVLLDSGSLATAMRASMSIPGVFTPAEIDGRLLVDGGIIANLPIDVVREMGADFVIAVDIGAQLVGREKLNSMLAVTSQAMTISSAQRVKLLLDSADLVLTPAVADRATLDFSDILSIVSEGEREARAHAERLTDLTLPPEDFTRHLQARKREPQAPRPLSRIDFRGLVRVDERIVRRTMATRVDHPLDFEVLRDDLGRIFGLGDFESVDFDVIPEGAEQVLVLEFKEKLGGPFFFRSALKLDVDETETATSNFVLNFTAIRLNTLGLEWRTDAQVGSAQRFESELYQPLDFNGRWFVAARVAQSRDKFKLFSGNSQSKSRALAEREQTIRGGGFDLGVALGNYAEIRVGAFRQRQKQRLVTGPELELQPTIEVGGWQASLALDRLDSIYFPRSGQLGTVVLTLVRPDLGADDAFEVAQVAHVGVRSWGRHTVLSWLEAGAGLDDDQPSYAIYGGGGLFSFSGYDRGELFGEAFAVLRPTYIYRLASLPPTIGKGIYFGAWLEAGNYWATRDAASFDDLRFAGTVTLGAETLVGPVYLAFGLGEGGRSQVSLSIGPSFSARPR